MRWRMIRLSGKKSSCKLLTLKKGSIHEAITTWNHQNNTTCHVV